MGALELAVAASEGVDSLTAGEDAQLFIVRDEHAAFQSGGGFQQDSISDAIFGGGVIFHAELLA